MPPAIDRVTRKVRRKRTTPKPYTPPPSRSDAAQRRGAQTPKPRQVKGPPAPVPNSRSDAAQRRGANTPTKPKVLLRRSRRKAKRDYIGLNPDRAMPGGNTRGIDATKSADYRAALVHLLSKEGRRLDGDSSLLKYGVRDNASNEELSETLAILRQTESKRTRDLLHPFGKTEYFIRGANGKTTPVDVEALELEAISQEDPTEAAIGSGVAKVLEQTTRPLHAIAGATDAVLKGENVPKAALRGLKNEDTTTFGEILEDAGAPGVVSDIVGFGLDVGLDPTTYLTLGTGSVARRAAEKAGNEARDKALAAGLSAQQAERYWARAAARELKRRGAADARGVTVKLAGREVPGVRAATAKAVPKLVRRAVRKSRLAQGSRHVAADLNPNIAPAGVTKAEAGAVDRATRTARARTLRGMYAAQQRAIAIKRKIGAENYRKVIDAVEADDFSKLTPDLRRAAVEVRDLFRYANRTRRQAGIPAGEVKRRARQEVPEITAQAAKDTRRTVQAARADVEAAETRLAQADRATAAKAAEDLVAATARLTDATAVHAEQKALRKVETKARKTALKENARRDLAAKGYVPHVQVDPADVQPRGRVRRAKGNVATATAKRRSDPRPLAEIRLEHPGVYSEDLPQLVAGRMSEAARVAARADLHRVLADTGRPIPRDGSALKVGPDEAVFHIKGATIKEITEDKILDKLTQSAVRVKKGDKLKPSYQGLKGGRYVIASKQAVDRALEGALPQMQGPGIVKSLDKVQGGFKAIATVPNPGFHIRNLIGDSLNAYLAESLPRLIRNAGQSARALAHLGRIEESMRTLNKRLDPSDAGLTIRGEKVSYYDLVVEAERVGAIRSGFIARELPELAQKDITKGRDRLHRFSRLIQNREDIIRLATYIGSRKRGLSPEKAAERSAKYHFDYGHLTSFERNIARRAMPFWTFSARNIPLQARTLVTKPGKYANFQKLREEAGRSAGFDDEQRQEVRDLYSKLKQAGVKVPRGWEGYLTEWEQRNAGIPIRAFGQQYTVSAGFPLTDIGLLPGAASLEDWAARAMGLATPIVKTPTELIWNYNFFFGDQLESDTSPLVPAPSFVGSFPADARERLGIRRGIDDKTGEKIWQWPGRVDYAAHAVPGPPSWAQRFATDRESGTAEKALAYAGIKATKFDPVDAAVGLAYDRMFAIEKEMAGLRQQLHHGRPINADNPTEKYQRLQGQLELVEEIAYSAKALRGDKVLPEAGKPSSASGETSIDWGDGAESGSPQIDWGDGAADAVPAGQIDWDD